MPAAAASPNGSSSSAIRAIPHVDPVDWIERIPFTETRQYVIKIMETLQLYRSRLAGPKRALQLVQDLNRGRKVPRAEARRGRAGKIAVRGADHAPWRRSSGLPLSQLC